MGIAALHVLESKTSHQGSKWKAAFHQKCRQHRQWGIMFGAMIKRPESVSLLNTRP